MRFLFSIVTLASIAGALMVLYVGAGSFLKLNQSSDEDKALAAERAAAMFSRMAQHNATLAKMRVNADPSFDLLGVSSLNLPSVPAQPASAQPESATARWPGASSDFGDHLKSYTVAAPKLAAVQPTLWTLAASRIFSDPPARIMPHRTPTPAEEARAVYRKYATPQ
jgi:hypothetical protein